VKDEIVREMAGEFGLRFRLPRKSQGSFTCRKSATWDRRLYFTSEGRHAVDFSREKYDGFGWVRTSDLGYQSAGWGTSTRDDGMTLATPNATLGN
jgi:hypothetical protein